MTTKRTTPAALKTALGPLWKIYSDDTVTGIFIDAFDEVYYFQRQGSKAEPKSAPKLFKSSKDLEAMVGRVVRYAGKKLDASTKSIYLNLDESTRVQIVLPPMAVKGPAISIHKIPMKHLTLDDLIQFKALDSEGKALILECIDRGRGVLVAGNHGSGKTTLLNTLVHAIPDPQRVVTIERFADLVVGRDKVCRLQTANQSAEELVELVALAERMHPDYLVAANFEGPEVMPFLEAARSSCSAMGLITGDNPLDAFRRLETKAVLSSEGMSLEEARYAISQSFHHLIFQEKRGDKGRLVSSIAEIVYDAGELKLKFVYQR